MNQETSTTKPPQLARLFGEYLLQRCLVEPQDLKQAFASQQLSNRPLGVLARRAGLLGRHDVESILRLQLTDCARFGEIAQEEGFLAKEQVDELLYQQTVSHVYLGEALVQAQVLTLPQLEEHLRAYKLHLAECRMSFRLPGAGPEMARYFCRALEQLRATFMAQGLPAELEALGNDLSLPQPLGSAVVRHTPCARPSRIYLLEIWLGEDLARSLPLEAPPGFVIRSLCHVARCLDREMSEPGTWGEVELAHSPTELPVPSEGAEPTKQPCFTTRAALRVSEHRVVLGFSVFRGSPVPDC